MTKTWLIGTERVESARLRRETNPFTTFTEEEIAEGRDVFFSDSKLEGDVVQLGANETVDTTTLPSLRQAPDRSSLVYTRSMSPSSPSSNGLTPRGPLGFGKPMVAPMKSANSATDISAKPKKRRKRRKKKKKKKTPEESGITAPKHESAVFEDFLRLFDDANDPFKDILPEAKVDSFESDEEEEGDDDLEHATVEKKAIEAAAMTLLSAAAKAQSPDSSSSELLPVDDMREVKSEGAISLSSTASDSSSANDSRKKGKSVLGPSKSAASASLASRSLRPVKTVSMMSDASIVLCSDSDSSGADERRSRKWSLRRRSKSAHFVGGGEHKSEDGTDSAMELPLVSSAIPKDSSCEVRFYPVLERDASESSGYFGEIIDGHYHSKKWNTLWQLRRGAALLKFGSRGKPRFHYFNLSPDNSRLVWYSAKKGVQSLAVEEIDKIQQGSQQTEEFKRVNYLGLNHSSFTLWYGENTKTLNLAAKSSDEMKLWAKSLEKLKELKLEGVDLSTLRKVMVVARFRDSLLWSPKRQKALCELKLKTAAVPESDRRRKTTRRKQLRKKLDQVTATVKELRSLSVHAAIQIHPDRDTMLRVIADMELVLEQMECEMVIFSRWNDWRLSMKTRALKEKMQVIVEASKKKKKESKRRSSWFFGK